MEWNAGVMLVQDDGGIRPPIDDSDSFLPPVIGTSDPFADPPPAAGSNLAPTELLLLLAVLVALAAGWLSYRQMLGHHVGKARPYNDARQRALIAAVLAGLGIFALIIGGWWLVINA